MKTQLFIRVTLSLALSAGLGSGVLWAQPRPQGGGKMGNNGGARGNMMMQSGKGRLPMLMFSIQMLDRPKRTPLTSAQAKKMVTLIAPWRKRATMSDKDAQSLSSKLDAVLTSAQKSQIAPRRSPRERPPMNRPPMNRPQRPPGGQMGRPPQGRQRPQMDAATREKMRAGMQSMFAFLSTYNPLYTGTYKQLSTLPPMMKEGFTAYNAQLKSAITALEKRARA